MAAGNDSGIFISYRRQDTAWPARELYEVIVREFRANRVFKDVDTIEPGEDFAARMIQAVASCDVLLVLIGPKWLTSVDQRGRRRLDDPDDFVRLEIRTALERDITVIPILVDEAAMPRAEELPPDLAPLTRRQAIAISPVAIDTKRLIRTIKTARDRHRLEWAPARTPVVESPPPQGWEGSQRRRWPWVIAGLVVAVAVLSTSAAVVIRTIRAPVPLPTAPSLAPLPTAVPLPPDQMVVTLKIHDNTDLWVIRARGGPPVRRLTVSNLLDTSPNLSPDRRTVIYRQQPSVGGDAESILRVVAVDGSGDRELFSTDPGECHRGIFRPTWDKSDPSRLAVMCNTATQSLAYLVNTDGRVIRQLSIPGPVFGDLSFSPDGHQLAFWSAAGRPESVRGGSISLLDLDSGQMRALTNVKAGGDGDLAWSPSGDTLAFRRRHDNGTKGGNFDLMTVPAEGGKARQWTTDSADEGSPCFSPDGQLIAYRSRARFKHLAPAPRVWIVNLHTDDKEPLWPPDDATNRYEQGRPAWITH